jgi:formylglycine-generating enzyme required for sulfatase activity
VVKLVDFGIAKLRESGAHTQTGMVLGTPAYMSFEQASGMRSDEPDARSDVYSLGVVVYEMLTGRTPFQSDTPVGYLRQHLQNDPPAFRAVKPTLAAARAVESAVMKALVKDRDQRYGSALEFAREFVSAAHPLPRAEAPVTIPPTPNAPPPARRRAARKPASPIPLQATVQAKADIANQTPAPAPPGKTVLPPSAQPQGSKPVAAANRQPALAKPPHHPLVKESSSGVKFVVLGLELLAVIAVGIWYFSLSGPEPPPNITSQPPRTTVPKEGGGRTEAPLANLPPAPRKAKVNPKDGLMYVWIPPGTFQMGCSPGDTVCDDGEKPPHQVTITKGFWLGQTEVTVAAYRRFVRSTGAHMPEAPDFNAGWNNQKMPIVNVSWDDATAFCGWTGGRLPTEAEWEYAARAGSTEARYSPIDEVAWYSNNSGNKTQEVAQKHPNAWNLYDTLGNVWEWVNDWYGENYYPGSPDRDPRGPDSGELRVLRGGSWDGVPRYVCVSGRGRYSPAVRNVVVGFRCGGELAGP